MNPEDLLPAAILATALRSGGEIGWREDDLTAALAAAEATGLAILGGQVQICMPGGTCELYWQNYDASPRRAAEAWPVFVARTHREVERGLHRLPDIGSLVVDAVANFEFLQQAAQHGSDLTRHVRFVCYFAADDGTA